MKPTCPECGSDKLAVIKAGNELWLECPSCRASFVASDERLIEACLLSHKDSEKPDVSPKFVAETSRLLRSLV